jgi:hypothetical protein
MLLVHGVQSRLKKKMPTSLHVTVLPRTLKTPAARTEPLLAPLSLWRL